MRRPLSPNATSGDHVGRIVSGAVSGLRRPEPERDFWRPCEPYPSKSCPIRCLNALRPKGLGGFLRSARPTEVATNFERPFTLRTSLRSPRNFGNARFRRFANFDFLTTKKNFPKKFRFFYTENFFRKNIRFFFPPVFHYFRSIFEELGFF